FRRDRLHRRFREPFGERAHRRRIAAEQATGESIDLVEGDAHGRASMLPERLGAFALDIRAVQSKVAEHAVIELPEQATASCPLPPIPESAPQAFQKPARSSWANDIGQRSRWRPSCIDTISVHVRTDLVRRGLRRIKLTPE